ncbi:MAG TPA: ASKHA domain-containing protein [Candidatus Limnocylindrales bacterium]|nr:ASKHA domain-containing protein [Candidatus Limnocylindrales bacterium]
MAQTDTPPPAPTHHDHRGGDAPHAHVIFTPSGRRGRVPTGTTVLDAARSLGVDIDSVCGGRGICGRCAVVPAFGTFAKHGITSAPDHLSEPNAVEQAYREEEGLAADRRLSCTACLLGDAVIDVPPESQVHRQVVRKDLAARAFEMDPVVRLHTVDVSEPDLATPTGDLGRLFDALRVEWDLTGLRADLAVVRDLQSTLEAGKYRVTVAVYGGHDVIAIWPGFRDRAFGVAIDVGSTTIAGHLVNLVDGEILASAGVMNPQIRFGEDLMSRVSYVMLHEGGDTELTTAVRKALDGLLASLANKAGIKRAEILELAIVGNPIMHHLLLGIDPTPLGSAPFALATDAAVSTTTAELGIRAHPGARVYVLPCIAGHVGADTAGVILAEEPHEAEPITLIVDVGTNAEIVLGNRHRLLAASSPTGPAFEGAQISSGQRAAPGAIERVRIDRTTLEPRFRVIGVEPWSDAPDFGAALEAAGTGVTGICGSGIIEVIAELFLAGVITADGVIDGSLAARTPRVIADGRTFSYVLHEPDGDSTSGGPRIVITQNDVRAIQLAKAALYAGARLLMDQLGRDTVDEVRLAGAFGSQIDPLHAMVLGLVPDCDLARVRAAGNAAGTGALIALLSGAARREIEGVVRRVEKIETAVEPRFQEHFVEAMAIPHRTAPTTNLERVVELPPRPPAGVRRPTDRPLDRRRRRAVLRPVPGDDR